MKGYELFEGLPQEGVGPLFSLRDGLGETWEAVFRWYSYMLSDGTSFTVHYWHPPEAS